MLQLVKSHQSQYSNYNKYVLKILSRNIRGVVSFSYNKLNTARAQNFNV